MTGEVLYRMYTKFMLEQGVGQDGWTALEDCDRAAWNSLASWIAGTE